MNIVFDMDDTLYDLREPFDRTHLEFFGEKEWSPEAMTKLFLEFRRYGEIGFDRWVKGEITKAEEFVLRVTRTYADVGIVMTPDNAAQFEERYRYYQKHITLPEEVRLILETLKAHDIPMAILSNGKHDQQFRKVTALGLMEWIPEDRIFISGDLPAAKPSKEAFLYVQEKLGLVPEETWYIGDYYEADIVGAVGAGWHSLLYNHRLRTPVMDQGKPDFEVKTPEDFVRKILKICGIA